jgi:transcriptional regulator with XRE-family HTH domain
MQQWGKFAAKGGGPVDASPKPLVQRRRLRAGLRAARQAAGQTLEQVADSMEWSLSKVIRIESGSVGVSANDLRALLSLYGISNRDRVDELLDLARASRQSSRWSRQYKADITSQYLEFIEYEEAASVLRMYEPLLLPGLWQTHEYAAEIIRELADPDTPESLIQTRIEIRMKRQELLDLNPPPIITCVLDEAAVQRTAGQRSIAQGQLARLIEMAGRPNITLEIVPFSAGFHRGMLEPFHILEFPDHEDSDILFSESSKDTILSRDESGEIAGYRAVFEDLRDASLGGAGTLTYLRDLASQIQE